MPEKEWKNNLLEFGDGGDMYVVSSVIPPDNRLEVIPGKHRLQVEDKSRYFGDG